MTTQEKIAELKRQKAEIDKEIKALRTEPIICGRVKLEKDSESDVKTYKIRICAENSWKPRGDKRWFTVSYHDDTKQVIDRLTDLVIDLEKLRDRLCGETGKESEDV